MGKENVKECLKEVRRAIRGFLSEQGGYDNGYYTYVSGIVYREKENLLAWNTPVAREELTDKGREARSKSLYTDLQRIMDKYKVDEITIRGIDVSDGCMRVEAVYVEETIERVTP